MKKIFFLAAATVALAACGGNAHKKADKTAEKRQETTAETSTQSGAYTAQREVTNEDLEIFDEAMQGLVGVRYTPRTVATQVVNGTNYKFICEAVAATNPSQTYRAEVVIYKPLPATGEKALLMSITRIENQNETANDSSMQPRAGAFTDQRPVTDADRKVFEEATEGIVGVGYTPETVATQIVKGTYYKFICKAVAATNPPLEYTAEVMVYQPLPETGGASIVVGIRRIVR